MSAVTAIEDESLARSQCWCCGQVVPPERLVHLGNHPEVALCIRCAHWASRQAKEIEDRSGTGVGVRVRDGMRVARRKVIERGWHRLPVFGALLRRLGRHTP
jgi:hypothetical protein